MGQNKIENDFREKLNQREIKPSDNAWDRLDAMLTVAEQKKPKRNNSWFYIAAAIISFIAIGTVFLSQTQEVIDSPHNEIVIGNELEIPAEGIDSVKITVPKKENDRIATTESDKSPNNQPQSNQKINQNQQSTVNAIPLNQSPERIAAAENQSLINQKAEQKITAPVKVDELLAAVTPTANQSRKTTVKINAKNLLSQVDGEIKVSFREKVIRTVNKNYQEVAEAVSNRNIQN